MSCLAGDESLGVIQALMYLLEGFGHILILRLEQGCASDYVFLYCTRSKACSLDRPDYLSVILNDPADLVDVLFD